MPAQNTQPNIFDRFVLDELTVPLGFKWGSLALHRAGYKTIHDLSWAAPEDILKVPHIGQRKMELIQEYFAKRGLTYPQRVLIGSTLH